SQAWDHKHGAEIFRETKSERISFTTWFSAFLNIFAVSMIAFKGIKLTLYQYS
ncbi:unnamed protein product, partial [Arabidopsis halleri]